MHGNSAGNRDRSNSDISSQNEEYKIADSSFTMVDSKFKDNEVTP